MLVVTMQGNQPCMAWGEEAYPKSFPKGKDFLGGEPILNPSLKGRTFGSYFISMPWAL